MRIILALCLFLLAVEGIGQAITNPKKGVARKAIQKSQKPKDFFEASTPIENPLPGVTTKETTTAVDFSPKNYPYLTGVTAFSNREGLERANANSQPYFDKVIRVFMVSNPIKIVALVLLCLIVILVPAINIQKNLSPKK